MGRSLAVLRMLCASSCLLLCAYGCGSSSPSYSGAVVVAQDFMLDSYFTVAFADFFSTSLRACSSTTSGACTLSACPNVDGGMPEVGAGTITVSGGLLTAPITFTADGTGSSGGFSGTTQIAANAGWGGDPQLAAAMASVFAFGYPSTTSKDSALLVTLSPGSYTAQASSVSGVSGTTIVEVYEVP